MLSLVCQKETFIMLYLMQGSEQHSGHHAKVESASVYNIGTRCHSGSMAI